VEKKGDVIALSDSVQWPAGRGGRNLPDGRYIIGIRPHHITPAANGKIGAPISGRVLVTEISGSESVIHFDMRGQTWVSQSHGVHPFDVGSVAKLYVDIDRAFFFDRSHRFTGGGG
jgi:glycerol transport system ATP-binding protein